MFNKFIFSSLPFLAALFLVSDFVTAEQAIYQNELQPFITDGCSFFPDGSLTKSETSWQHCCVKHDSLYWKGGTSAERVKADIGLKDCVNKEVPFLGDVMFTAVRAGGSSLLPFSWRWGYGWVVPRSSLALNDFEKEQVNELWPNLDKALVIAQPVIQKRDTITNDYCVDLVLQRILEKYDVEFFSYEVIGDSTKSFGETWIRSFTLNSSSLGEKYKASLFLTKNHSCKLKKIKKSGKDVRKNDLTLKAEIQIRKIEKID